MAGTGPGAPGRLRSAGRWAVAAPAGATCPRHPQGLPRGRPPAQPRRPAWRPGRHELGQRHVGSLRASPGGGAAGAGGAGGAVGDGRPGRTRPPGPAEPAARDPAPRPCPGRWRARTGACWPRGGVDVVDPGSAGGRDPCGGGVAPGRVPGAYGRGADRNRPPGRLVRGPAPPDRPGPPRGRPGRPPHLGAGPAAAAVRQGRARHGPAPPGAGHWRPAGPGQSGQGPDGPGAVCAPPVARQRPWRARARPAAGHLAADLCAGPVGRPAGCTRACGCGCGRGRGRRPRRWRRPARPPAAAAARVPPQPVPARPPLLGHRSRPARRRAPWPRPGTLGAGNSPR